MPCRHRDRRSVLMAGYSIKRDTWGIHENVSYTEPKNTQGRAFTLGFIGTGLCLREYRIFSTLSKPFSYPNCSVTLSRLPSHLHLFGYVFLSFISSF